MFANNLLLCDFFFTYKVVSYSNLLNVVFFFFFFPSSGSDFLLQYFLLATNIRLEYQLEGFLFSSPLLEKVKFRNVVEACY